MFARVRHNSILVCKSQNPTSSVSVLVPIWDVRAISSTGLKAGSRSDSYNLVDTEQAGPSVENRTVPGVETSYRICPSSRFSSFLPPFVILNLFQDLLRFGASARIDPETSSG